jgi:deoxycytidylate deaminase
VLLDRPTKDAFGRSALHRSYRRNGRLEPVAPSEGRGSIARVTERNELEQTELFIGLVAAVGTDVGMVADLLASELAEYAYSSEILRLSDYLADLEGVGDFRSLPFDERVWEAMSAGDELRRDWQRGDALSLWAISDIVATREEKSDSYIEEGEERNPAGLSRHAFILRSMKTQAEVETLRAVYGSRFFLFAAYTPDDKREEHLAGEIERSRKTKDRKKWAHQPEALIDRDYEEEETGGQEVSRTFHRADFFVRGTDSDSARQDIERALEILFGHPYRTPTRDEFGQFQAAGAAVRSAELGRQVGAAVATRDGSIIALGTNEVPKVGGGSHWEEDGKGNREFEHVGRDTNQQYQEEIARKLAESISGLQKAQAGKESAASPGEAEALAPLLLDSGLREITEFGRAVHAEMDALLDAARRGISVRDCTLHTTTFPCHNCARHLIAAGIAQVTFIEPYPKSKAGPLHEDSIAIAQSDPGNRVDFQPFVGVAPRRYLQLFDAGSRERRGHLPRKDPDGKRTEFSKKQARPVYGDLEPKQLRPLLPSYRVKELIALGDFDQLTKEQEEMKTSTKEKEASNG